MYFRILKKDLKRKKTMNLILLIFIILASTFIASSAKNLLSITKAMESYFEQAGLSDFMIITLKDEKNDVAISKFLDENKNIVNWVVDEDLYISDENIKLHNGKKFNMATSGIISSFNIKQQKFFDSNDKVITEVKNNQVYMPIALMEKNDLKVGDSITVVSEEFSMDFTIADNCKDAFLGSTMMGVARFVVNDYDYSKLKQETQFSIGNLYSVYTQDLENLQHDYNQMGFNVIVSCDQRMVSTTYVIDMVIAGVLLIVSICLILISLVILRFTIVFTLNEEFRQIGIMKAIGLKERNIRGLYIIKYFGISVSGSAIGLVLSVPFGNLFLEQVSKNIVVANGSTGVGINIIFSSLIVVIVILFCYFCTRQVNKFSPVDAIRNGSNGERFKRKGLLRLYKSKISTILFMACNDILSGPKKFGVLLITFTIGIILVIVPINTINTLKGDKLVTWFGMVESDVYLANEKQQMDFIFKGHEYAEDYLKTVKKTLQDNGISANVFNEMAFQYKITLNDEGYVSYALQGNGTTTDQYNYIKGQPPMFENEVALTHITADAIGANIGDTVKIKIDEIEHEFMVTGIYQSMNNMGEGIRFHEKTKLDYKNAVGGFALQVKYNDHPSQKEKQRRFEKMKQLFPEFKVFIGGEYISDMMGNVANQIEKVKQIIIVVIIMINILVTVLILRTFITKEKGEIGMLKSIGFRNSDIVKWQILRIGIILLISDVLGALLSNPLSQISSGKVFEMMGASHIEFTVNPFEVYVLYPLIIFVTTMIASGLTALQIRKISTQEINNIE